MLKGNPASYPGGSRNTLTHFMLLKPELSAESFELVVFNPFNPKFATEDGCWSPETCIANLKLCVSTSSSKC